MKCVYCYEEKLEFTKEHIIPKSIGGNLEPENPFLINEVCKRCNNVAGLYIDAPFIKNWFVNNSRVSNAKKYTNLKSRPILPLRYFGKLSQITFEKKICEYWLGPTGDGIYHFHEPYPEEVNVGIDGRPKNKNIEFDQGFVFLLIRSNNPEWHPCILFSVIENFKGSILYLGNGIPPQLDEFQPIPKKLKLLHEQILGLNRKKHTCQFSIVMGFEERFLAKIALGIGAKYLNSTFIGSKDANLLRSFMHEKDWVKRKNHKVRFTGMIPRMDDQDSDFMKDLTTWPGGHTILLLSLGDMLALWVNFYEHNTFGIIVSENPTHWKGKIDKSGLLFILSPTLKKVVGPLSLITLVAHKNEEQMHENKQLKELEKLMEENSMLPPIMI